MIIAILIILMLAYNSYATLVKYKLSNRERHILHEGMDYYRRLLHDHPEEFEGTPDEKAHYEVDVQRLYRKIKQQIDEQP